MVRHQNVKPPERRDGRGNQLPSRFRSREIALDRTAVSRAQFTNQFLGLRLGRLIVENNLGPRVHKHAYCSRTNAAGPAGNQSNFRIQRKVHRSK